ncbi:MAG TPA: nucleotide exchange factor GrpE [Solirubrobacteraceae bacterium]|nr:nucleotide exchange factor GrpE [Solirubrobacteraceae bacterium]
MTDIDHSLEYRQATDEQSLPKTPGAQAPGETDGDGDGEARANFDGAARARDARAQHHQKTEDTPRGSVQDTPQASGVVDGAERALQGDLDDLAAAGANVDDLAAAGANVDELAAAGVEVDELAAAGAQRDEYLALAQRTQADFENYRKRMARESAVAQERGVAKLAKELLPALDNLDRALDAADRDDPLLEGVRLVRAELGAALARVGVASFSPLGETFDPVKHEAMAQQPVEGAVSGTVVEVFQAGYELGGNVIRPARVLVAA